MKFSRPRWLTHSPTKIKGSNMYSISFHPSEPKIATSSSDYSIKIWSTETINKSIDEPEIKVEENGAEKIKPKRLLATLSHHSGAVLCIRFSNMSGKFLASSSDDKVILIWRHEESLDSKDDQPTEDGNIEFWRAIRRLTGHYMDIVDLAWSSNNKYLASASLDNSVFIHSGTNFNLLHKIEVHTGFVKGISFDPLDRYLATSSDDRTARIFDISDWSEVTTLKETFTNCPIESLFRRLDWSPDGTHLITSNAYHKKKDVACLVSSDTWKPEFWIFGHLRSIGVVKFNHFLFKQPNKQISKIIAIGAQDHMLSVWKTGQRQPLICCQSVFGDPITDLAWSSDGMTLVASSFDGASCCLSFTTEELGTPISYHQLNGTDLGPDLHLTGMFLNENDSNYNTTNGRAVNHLIPVRVDKDGKKRLQLVGTSPTLNQSPSTSVSHKRPTVTLQDDETSPNQTARDPSPKRAKLSGDTVAAIATNYNSNSSNNPEYQINLKNLIPVPITQKLAKYTLEESSSIRVEIKNQSVNKSFSTITCYKSDGPIWSDILKSDGIVFGGSSSYHYVGCKNQELIIYTANGTKILPPLKLEGIPCFIALEESFLACLTNSGIIYCWDLENHLTVLNPSSITYLLCPTDGKRVSLSSKVISLGIQKLGAPYICLNSGASYLYNLSFRTWVTITEPFFERVGLQETSSFSKNQSAKGIKMPGLKSSANTKSDLPVIKMDKKQKEAALCSYLEQTFHASYLWNDNLTINYNLEVYVKHLFKHDHLDKIVDTCKQLFDRHNRILATDQEIIRTGLKLIDFIRPFLSNKINSSPLNQIEELYDRKFRELTS